MLRCEYHHGGCHGGGEIRKGLHETTKPFPVFPIWNISIPTPTQILFHLGVRSWNPVAFRLVLVTLGWVDHLHSIQYNSLHMSIVLAMLWERKMTKPISGPVPRGHSQEENCDMREG